MNRMVNLEQPSTVKMQFLMRHPSLYHTPDMSFTTVPTEGYFPMARINWPGSEWHQKTVYVSEEEPNVEAKAVESKVRQQDAKLIGMRGRSKWDALGGRAFFDRGSYQSSVTKRGLKRAREAIEGGELDVEGLTAKGAEHFEKKCKQAKKEIQKQERKLSLDGDGFLEPLCNPYARQAPFVVGMAGAGKSVWSGQYVRSYNRCFPENKVYLLSPHDDDPAFAGIQNMTQIKLD